MYFAEAYNKLEEPHFHDIADATSYVSVSTWQRGGRLFATLVADLASPGF